MSDIRTCVHCGTRVIPKQDGTCPSCGQTIAAAAEVIQPAGTPSQNPYAAPRELAPPGIPPALRVLMTISGCLLLSFSALMLLIVVIALPQAASQAPKDTAGAAGFITGVICSGLMFVVPPAFSGYSLIRGRWKTGLIVICLYVGGFALLCGLGLMLRRVTVGV